MKYQIGNVYCTADCTKLILKALIHLESEKLFRITIVKAVIYLNCTL